MKVKCSGLVPGQGILYFRIDNLFPNSCNIESQILTNTNCMGNIIEKRH